MDRRSSRRWPRQLEARLWKSGQEHSFRATATNVSLTGIWVRTPNVAPIGTRFRVEMAYGGAAFVVETVVARAIRTPPHIQTAKPSGMGLRYLTPDELLEELLPGLISSAREEAEGSAPGPAAPSARRPGELRPPSAAEPSVSAAPAKGAETASPLPESPVPADRLFRIRYRDREQFRRVFERDIEGGGLFVPAMHPPELEAVIRVEVSIDEADGSPVRVEGRVVHRMEAAPGEESEGSLLSGMGVQFTDIPRAVERLRALLG